MEYITLNNGIKIPQLGLGTYLLKPDDAQSSVTSALGMGYELIDTANAYVNERAVGRGVRESDLPRENVYLETKLWPYFYGSIPVFLSRTVSVASLTRISENGRTF
mgnify:CR=1 FL=1